MTINKVFKRFYGFLLHNQKLLFGIFLLLSITSNIAFNLNPFFYKKFVENIPSLDFPALLNILFIFMIIRVLGVIFDILAFVVGDKILFEAAKDARIQIFKKVGALDFAFHSEKSTGSLISAFKRGDSAFFSFFHDIHARAFSVFIGFVVMLYFLTQLNFFVSLLVLSSLIITIVSARFLVANNVAKRKIFNKEEDEISGIITDNLINFETVKMFAKEDYEAKRLKKSFNPWTKALWGYANSFRLIDLTLGAIINISIFLILFITLKKAVLMEITIGDFVLITGFLSGFFPQLWNLVWSSRDLAKNYADIQKYFGLLDYEETVPDPKFPKILKKADGDIEFKNITHSYKGGTKNAIHNFNLKISPGESIALVGRSGSGKTTITKLLMRFFDPESGKITIDGIDIKKLKKENLRDLFGVVPQEPILFNNTIGYNIAYGRQQGQTLLKDQVRQAAKLANISDFIESLPNKYKSNVGERGIKLSGGQKQRLAIARMIMSNPDIIIFDEATSHLDSESEKLIQDAFWKVAKGKTTIIVAHRLSTIRHADRIIVMDKGRIIEEGSHEDLLKKDSGIYKKLWNLQLEK